MKKKGLILSLVLAIMMSVCLGTAVLVHADAEKPEISLQMVDTVQLREDENGLRFKAKMDKATYDYVMENDNVNVAFIIMPSRYLSQLPNNDGNVDYSRVIVRDEFGEYDKENSYCLYVLVDKNSIYSVDDVYYCHAGVSPVEENNYGLDFVAVACLEIKNGEDYTYEYADPETDAGMPSTSQYKTLITALFNEDDYMDIITEQYDWLGNDNYPIIVDNDDDYVNLVSKINGGKDFEGLNIRISSTVDTTKAVFEGDNKLPETAKTAYIITFTNYYGDDKTVTVLEGENLVVPNNSVKEGYEFSWGDVNTTPDSNAEYTEKKTAIEYTAKVVRADASEETVKFTIENRDTQLASIQLTENTAGYMYSWENPLPEVLELNNNQVFTEVKNDIFTTSNATITNKEGLGVELSGGKGASFASAILDKDRSYELKFSSKDFATISEFAIYFKGYNGSEYTGTYGKILFASTFITVNMANQTTDPYYLINSGIAYNSTLRNDILNGLEVTVKLNMAAQTFTVSTANATQDVALSPIPGRDISVGFITGYSVEIAYEEASSTGSVLVTSFDECNFLTAEKVAVTFNTNGGSEVATQYVYKGLKVAIPTAPTKSGSWFLGWQKDGVDFDFGTPITEAITLDAVWSDTPFLTNNSGDSSIAGQTQPHPDEGYEGVAGVKLISSGDSATFDYLGTASLVEGENVIAKFMTTDPIRKYLPDGAEDKLVYEVSHVQFIITDNNNNTIKFQVAAATDLNRPNADFAVFYNDNPIGVVGDQFYTNFSNMNLGDYAPAAFKLVPEIKLNTTTGVATYGISTIQSDNFIGFGVDGIKSAQVVVFTNVHGYGIVLETLCGQDLT